MAQAERVFTIEHCSTYNYTAERTSCVMSLCLMPLSNSKQRVEAFELIIDPLTQPIPFEDFLGNACHLINIHQPHTEVSIRSKSLVCLKDNPNKDSVHSQLQNPTYELGGYADYWDYEQPTARTAWSEKVEAFLEEQNLSQDDDTYGSLYRLEQGIYDALRYTPQSTTVDTMIDEVLVQRAGVCQDFAHLMIAVARHWNIPARYVMGYLCSDAQPVANAQATHAWVECLIQDRGWVCFDPTNPTLRDSGYITVAHGRDFEDVCPTKGVNIGSGDEELQVEVTVLNLSS